MSAPSDIRSAERGPADRGPTDRGPTARIAGAEREIAALAGRLVLFEVDAALLVLLRSLDVAAVLDKAEPGCGQWLETPPTLDELAADYCDLFVLPGGLAPVASAWVDEGDRDSFFQQLGEVFPFEVEVASPFDTPPDHFGRLLSSLALENLPPENRAELIRALTAPTGAFAVALRKRDTNPLYRACGHLIAALFQAPLRA